MGGLVEVALFHIFWEILPSSISLQAARLLFIVLFGKPTYIGPGW